MPPRPRKTFSKRLENYVVVPKPEMVMMGHPDGSLIVDAVNEPMMIWVTGRYPRKVLNLKVPNQWGVAVMVGYSPWDLPNRLQVLCKADLYPAAGWMGPSVMTHADTHGWSSSGTDLDWVARERVVYFTTVPGINSIDIYPDAKPLPDGTFWWGKEATRVDYSAGIPASGACICIVVLDASGATALRTGTVVATKQDLTSAHFPATTAGDSALAVMILYAGMTQASHVPGNDDFIMMDLGGISGSSTSAITELTGDVTATGPGVVAATISAEAVENSMMAKMPTFTIKGNKEITDAVPTNLTMSEFYTMGSFGGAIEDLTAQVTGAETHFTFTDPAYAIWVLRDGVIQPASTVTFVSQTNEFDLSFAPAADVTLAVVRLVPTVAIPNPPQYPKSATMWHDQSVVVTGNPLVTTHDTNQNYAQYSQASPAGNGSVVENGFVIAAGTYTLKILRIRQTASGKFDTSIDGGASLGLTDGYGVLAYNSVTTFTGIVLTEGYHKVTITTNGKHASSSGYNVLITKIWLEPSAY